jgi:RNA recognition motif-containing protein
VTLRQASITATRVSSIYRDQINFDDSSPVARIVSEQVLAADPGQTGGISLREWKVYAPKPNVRTFLSALPGNEPGFSVRNQLRLKLSEGIMPSKLYVGNLAFSVSNDDLHELFSQAGQVQSATVISDKFSGQSRGFGFVEMTTSEEAAKAIGQFNDSELKGRNIKVNEAKPRESSFGGGQRDRNSGGGAGRGRNRW